MWPTLFEIPTELGALGVHSYGLMVTLGFVVGIGTALSLARRVGIALESMMALFVVAAVGGGVGARLLYVLSVGDPSALFGCSTGFAYYGGVLGGAAAVLVTAAALREDPWKVLDAGAPALLLGGAIGRLGCVLAGCCHGGPVVPADPATPLLSEGTLQGQVYTHPHFPFLSLAFDGGAARIHDVPVYPTQLWQALGMVALGAVLLALHRRRRFDGQLAALTLLIEPVLRFVVEAFRGDRRGYALSWTMEDPPAWMRGMASAGDALPGLDGAVTVGLTTSQGIGLAMILVGVAVWFVRSRVPRGEDAARPETYREDDPLLAALDE